MAEDDHGQRLEEIAGRILDGRPIDWNDLESGAGDRERGLMRQLRLVSAVATVHRSVTDALPTNEPSRTGEPMPLPATWGALEVLEHVGRGSFGDVYRAWDPRLAREVALKLVWEHGSASLASPVVEEGSLLARVRHPNVLTVHGAERIEGRVGIWTEYVRGETLADEVARRGPLPVEEAAGIGVDVCSALAAVHAAGLLHRDVKAHNVLRESTGRIVLSDFGTGIEVEEDAAVSEPRVAGTPLYMAPEIFERKAASVESDLYSVGVLLYFLVTGRYPVEGRTFAEIKLAHRAGLRVPLRDRRPDLPLAFSDIVDALLGAGLDRRYATASAVKAALGPCRLDGETAGAVGTAILKRRRRAATVALVAALLMVVAAGSWQWRRGSRPVSGIITAVPLKVEPSKLMVITAAAASPDGKYRPPTGRKPLTTNQLTFTVPETALLTAALSPDGKLLAYTALNGLFLQRLDGRVPVQLERPGDSDVSDLAWLPDSTTLLIAGAGGVWRMSAPDQVPRRVLDGAERVVVSPDGSFVALSRGAGGVWVATPDGDRQWQVVEAQPNTRFGEPAWSPDGQRLAYPLHEQTSRGVRAAVESRRLDGTAKTTIFDGDVHQVVWTPDGRVLIARPLPPPRARYTNWWQVPVDTATGEPLEEARQITDFPDFNFTHPTLTADGSRLAFVRTRLRGDIVTTDFDPDGPTMTDLRRQVFTGGDTLPSSWTPSGDALFFISDERLYQQGRGQTVAQEHLPSGAGRVSHAVVSPDGAWLLYLVDRGLPGNALMRVATSGGLAEPVDWHPHAIQMLRDTAASTTWLRCSRWPADVCVASDLVEGQLRLATVDPTRGTSEELAVLPRTPSYRNGWDLSRDGSHVASLAVSGSSGRILILNVATRGVRELRADWLGAAQSMAWRGDGRGWIVTIATGAAGGQVFSVDIDGSSTVIWQSQARRLWNPTVSPDGRSIVFSSLAVENDAWTLEGFGNDWSGVPSGARKSPE